MADNIIVNQGSEKTIAGDEVSFNGVTATEQVVKIALGAKGAHDCLIDSGSQTSANSLPVVIASDQDFIKSEDAAHSSGDKGIMPLAVQTSSLSALAGSVGDYAPLQVDNSTGALKVQVVGNSTTSLLKGEDIAHVSGDSGVMILGVRNDASSALSGTDGDYTPFATDSAGMLKVRLRSEYTEDAASANGDVLVGIAAIRNDSLATKTGADGDYVGLACDSIGRIEVTTPASIVAVTPTISNGVAYTANDQLGGVQTITSATTATKFQTRLVNVSIIDKAKQSAAITIFFFNASPTVASSDNAALDITDAEMASKYIGHVEIGSGDYASIAASSVACKECYLMLASASANVYAVAMTTGTPTYGSTSDLIFNYHWEKI